MFQSRHQAGKSKPTASRTPINTVEAFGAVIASLLRGVIDGVFVASTGKGDGKINVRRLDLSLLTGQSALPVRAHTAPRYIGRLSNAGRLPAFVAAVVACFVLRWQVAQTQRIAWCFPLFLVFIYGKLGKLIELLTVPFHDAWQTGNRRALQIAVAGFCAWFGLSLK